ncbi:MAG: helix-turn-helix transcriptional regulator [Desulfuromonadales bacterium]
MTSLLRKAAAAVSPCTRKFVERQGAFSVRITEIMNVSGMTQRQLAEKLGKNESYISRIVAGWANPTLRTIVEFEVALGQDIIDIPYQKKSHVSTVIGDDRAWELGEGVSTTKMPSLSVGTKIYYINTAGSSMVG